MSKSHTSFVASPGERRGAYLGGSFAALLVQTIL
jgi:hypothetical protein